MGELPDGRFHGQEPTQGIAVFLGRISPIGFDWIPEFAQTFFVGVAVLNDEPGHALRMFGKHAISDWRAVIHQIDRIAVDPLGVVVHHGVDPRPNRNQCVDLRDMFGQTFGQKVIILHHMLTSCKTRNSYILSNQLS